MDGTFDILMGQLPGWFKPVLEYIAIMRAYGTSLGAADGTVQRIHDNDFIQSADEQTLRYWERLMSLPYKAGDTVEYRRQRILTALNQSVPYTFFDLRDDLQSLFGDDYTLDVNPQEMWIKITTSSDRYGAVSLLRELIAKRVPAHLYVYSNQQVTNYSNGNQYAAARVVRIFEQTIGTGGD